ncbi:histidinol-phosphate transaminase [Nakamurella deserti]|uniref:histidinol-phosphate transaminase n=1 Tax=Nakamurella deserti TaxID=2164074 RepID=UPI000DBE13CC|nr:histidinol-phosphate transaminase [Nakamurella deserti]
MTSSVLVDRLDPAAPALRAAVAGLPAYLAGRRSVSELTAALASNESHYPPLPSVVDVVREQALRINRYPDMGAVELRERIAAHLGATVDEIAVGPGSVGVLQQIVTALCDAGDEVVHAWRSFEAYPILVSLAGARSVGVPLRADESHDLDAMAAAITDRTRVVVLCSPNNPTGVSISAGELDRFLAGVPASVLVVLDEAYVEYATRPDTIDAMAVFRAHGNVCVLRTFSKAYGLAGLRVGYAVARPALADGLRRTGIPFAVSGLAQRAAIASLDAVGEMRDRVAAVVAERRRVTDALRSAGWQLPDSEANFVWLRADDTLRARLVDTLADADILVRGYAGDGVRISLADRATDDRVLAVLSDRGRFPD